MGIIELQYAKEGRLRPRLAQFYAVGWMKMYCATYDSHRWLAYNRLLPNTLPPSIVTTAPFTWLLALLAK